MHVDFEHCRHLDVAAVGSNHLDPEFLKVAMHHSRR